MVRFIWSPLSGVLSLLALWFAFKKTQETKRKKSDEIASHSNAYIDYSF